MDSLSFVSDPIAPIDPDIQQQIDNARHQEEVLEKREPRAKRAWFNPVDHTIEVELKTGVRASFPVHLLQGLQGATLEQLAEVEVSPSGYGLHWESLDADLAVPALMSQIFGSGAWMAELERTGKLFQTLNAHSSRKPVDSQ